MFVCTDNKNEVRKRWRTMSEQREGGRGEEEVKRERKEEKKWVGLKEGERKKEKGRDKHTDRQRRKSYIDRQRMTEPNMYREHADKHTVS